MYPIRVMKYIVEKTTTDKAKIKTKAWLWGFLAGACIFNLMQKLAGA